MTTRHTRSGRERREARAALHGERAAIQVGKAGLTPAVLEAVDEALEARETIKVRIARSCPLSPAEIAARLAEELDAEVVGVVGRAVLLLRPAAPGGE